MFYVLHKILYAIVEPSSALNGSFRPIADIRRCPKLPTKVETPELIVALDRRDDVRRAVKVPDPPIG